MKCQIPFASPTLMLLLLLLLQVHVIGRWWWWLLLLLWRRWALLPSSVLQVRRVLAIRHNGRVHARPVVYAISIASFATTTARSPKSTTPAHVLLLLLLHKRQHFTPAHISTSSESSGRIIIKSTAVHVIEPWRRHARPHRRWRSTALEHLVGSTRLLLLCQLLLLLLLTLHRLALNQLGQTLLCLEERIES